MMKKQPRHITGIEEYFNLSFTVLSKSTIPSDIKGTNNKFAITIATSPIKAYKLKNASLGLAVPRFGIINLKHTRYESIDNIPNPIEIKEFIKFSSSFFMK